jgi:hypothetical protein
MRVDISTSSSCSPPPSISQRWTAGCPGQYNTQVDIHTNTVKIDTSAHYQSQEVHFSSAFNDKILVLQHYKKICIVNCLRPTTSMKYASPVKGTLA